LTHRSWVNENPGKRGSNERVEFLGDAVLEFVVTVHLYKKLPEQTEGYLTFLRAKIVNTVNLSKLGRQLKLGDKILMSKGEELTRGRDRNSLLADTIEAIIGSIYLDRGLPTAQKFIEENLLSDLEEKIKEPVQDPKSLLQVATQAKTLGVPKYNVLKTTGPDHDRVFEVEVTINGDVMGIGVGKNKSEAEQKAASIALERLKQL